MSLSIDNWIWCNLFYISGAFLSIVNNSQKSPTPHKIYSTWVRIFRKCYSLNQTAKCCAREKLWKAVNTKFPKISNPVSTTPKVKTKQNSSCYGTLTVTFEGYSRNAAIHSLNLWSKTVHDKFLIMKINELEIVNYETIEPRVTPILRKIKTTTINHR